MTAFLEWIDLDQADHDTGSQAGPRCTPCDNSGREVCWRAVLRHCAARDLQAAPGDPAPLLAEAKDLPTAPPEGAGAGITEVMVEAPSIHSARNSLNGCRIDTVPRLRLRGCLATRLAGASRTAVAQALRSSFRRRPRWGDTVLHVVLTPAFSREVPRPGQLKRYPT